MLKLFVLLCLVSCASFEKETLKCQNDKTINTLVPNGGR